MKQWFASTFLVVTLMVAPSAFAEPKLEGTYRDWNVFSISQAGSKVCYISTNSQKETGTFKRRSEPYLLVTYRGKDRAEISVSSGYPYSDKDVELVIDTGRFQIGLFTSDDTPKVAWAKSTKDDRDIINAMRRGNSLTIKGYSKLGTHSIDTYSLMGFTKAYNSMLDLCE